MANQQVVLQLQRVRCVDETGGKYAERFGNDEMRLAAIGADAAGNAFLLSPFSVGANFDDGEVTTFSPKPLLTMDVPDNGVFPKECHALLMLAEIDGGGFNDAVEKAFAKLKEEIAKKKSEMQARGSSLLGITWDAVWKVVIPLVAAYLKDRIAAGVSDDIFAPRDIKVRIDSGAHAWPDGTKLSPEETVEFRGHDGVYKVTYYWEVKTVNAPRREGLPDHGRIPGGVLVNG